MPVDVRIPTLGESVTEGVIVRWIKSDGEVVATDEPLLELETDKASVEIPAQVGGVLRILRPEGETVQVGDVVASIEVGAGASKSAAAAAPAAATPNTPTPESAAASAPLASDAVLSPAVRRLVQEHELDAAAIKGSGRGGRLTKGDVLAHLETTTAPTPEVPPGPASVPSPPPASASSPPPTSASAPSAPPAPATEVVPARPHLAVAPRAAAAARPADEERVPMTRLRQRIAERLVQAQQTAAILTTFNEVDMQPVMDLRARHKARFAERHGVALGFMSFFARASIAAMRDVPIVNARIDGTDVVTPKHVHLAVAVGTARGLVVPVIHHADEMSFAELEREIERLAGMARDNKLSIDDLSGGTFTISNGGVYGSLLSTPILNPPQSAILGMHKIEKRPVVIDDAIVIRPMMYLALSYDHRLIDGQQAVTFLVRLKERLEDPTRLMLEV